MAAGIATRVTRATWRARRRARRRAEEKSEEQEEPRRARTRLYYELLAGTVRTLQPQI